MEGKPYRLIISRPGSLLSRIKDVEITQEQSELVEKLIEATTDADSVELAFIGVALMQSIEAQEIH